MAKFDKTRLEALKALLDVAIDEFNELGKEHPDLVAYSGHTMTYIKTASNYIEAVFLPNITNERRRPRG